MLAAGVNREVVTGLYTPTGCSNAKEIYEKENKELSGVKGEEEPRDKSSGESQAGEKTPHPVAAHPPSPKGEGKRFFALA